MLVYCIGHLNEPEWNKNSSAVHPGDKNRHFEKKRKKMNFQILQIVLIGFIVVMSTKLYKPRTIDCVTHNKMENLQKFQELQTIDEHEDEFFDYDEQYLLIKNQKSDSTVVYGDTEETKQEQNTNIKCNACYKIFANSSSLKRHLGRYPLCAHWLEPNTGVDTINIIDYIDQLKDRILHTDETPLECRYCHTSFINSGNLIKHFKISVVCSRLAHIKLTQLIKPTP